MFRDRFLRKLVEFSGLDIGLDLTIPFLNGNFSNPGEELGAVLLGQPDDGFLEFIDAHRGDIA